MYRIINLPRILNVTAPVCGNAIWFCRHAYGSKLPIHTQRLWSYLSVLSEREKSKICTAETKYLRRVKGVTRKVRIRSDRKTEELKIRSIAEFIELGWMGSRLQWTARYRLGEFWKQDARQIKVRKTERNG